MSVKSVEFTDLDRAALAHAKLAVRAEVEGNLMTRAETFCAGLDDLAEYWDGRIAQKSGYVEVLDRLHRLSYGITS